MACRLLTTAVLVAFVLALPAADVLSTRSRYQPGSAWPPQDQNLHPAPSQQATNGKSILGTLDAKSLVRLARQRWKSFTSGAALGLPNGQKHSVSSDSVIWDTVTDVERIHIKSRHILA